MTDEPDTCPSCGADLRGEPIPQHLIDQGLYGPATTHYQRMVGNEVSQVFDGILFWSCPDCDFAWTRAFSAPALRAASESHVAQHNEAR